jgi:hypothetical protein
MSTHTKFPQHMHHHDSVRKKKGTMTEIGMLRRDMRHLVSRGGRPTWIMVVVLLLLAALESSVSFVPRAGNGRHISITRLHSIQRRDTEMAWSEMSKRCQRGCMTTIISFCVLLGIWSYPHLEASASDPFPAGQRYWSIMSKESTSSVQERITANEALLD